MRKPVIKDRIYRHLLQKLATGQWPSGHVLPSLRRVSHELHVSHQPVHLVWQEAMQRGLLEKNGQGEIVVTTAAERLAVDFLAEIARKARSRRLAILVPHRFSLPLKPTLAPLQTLLTAAVTNAGHERGYQCDVISMNEIDQLEQARRVVHGYDAAFVVELSPQYLPLVTHMVESGLPTTTYQRKIPGLPVPALIHDNDAAAGKMAELLINYGHRNITFIGMPCYDFIMGDRMVPGKGWQEALETAGIMDECIMPFHYCRGLNLHLTIEKLLTLRPRITGVVSGLLITAAVIRNSPRLANLRIPDDLSLAVLGPIGSYALPEGVPPLTCLEIDWPRAGQCAIEMIDRLIAGDSNPLNIRIPLKLHLTESVGQAPGTTAP